MRLDDLANLDPARRAALEREVTTHGSLVDAIRWSIAAEPGRSPADAIANVVVQDEYTHDVVLRWRDGHAIVYDTT